MGVLKSNGADGQYNIPFVLEDYAAGQGMVETKLDLWGFTTGSHEINIADAGGVIDTQQYQGITVATLSGQLSPVALANGTNVYGLTIPGRGVIDHQVLEKIEVSYPRYTVVRNGMLNFAASGDIMQVDGLQDVSSLRVIRETTNDVRYIPESRIRKTQQADGSWSIKFTVGAETANYYVSEMGDAVRLKADFKLVYEQEDLISGSARYLIVSHPDFIDVNMDVFVATKQAQGYSVKVADVDAVYASFGHGHFGAQAIRNYIEWAHANMGTEMVLLVGDDMFDYHENIYQDAMSFIPSIYTQTSLLVNIAPVDAKYVDFDDDDVPDIPIGRFIPRTSEEWAAMVNKTTNYTQHPNPRTIVLSADEFDIAQQYDFTADAQQMFSRLPANWQDGVSKFYIDELGVSQARSGLLQALDVGPAITSFVGHSGPRDWTFAGLFKSSDATNMMNFGSPTVVTQWGCWNTYYASPNGSLANEFMRNANGAAAVLGAIALTEAKHEQVLALEVYDRLFEPGTTIGEAVLQAKQAYASNNPVNTHKDVILGWTLLSDPALIIAQ